MHGHRIHDNDMLSLLYLYTVPLTGLSIHTLLIYVLAVLSVCNHDGIIEPQLPLIVMSTFLFHLILLVSDLSASSFGFLSFFFHSDS